jgi:hypothetical protein
MTRMGEKKKMHISKDGECFMWLISPLSLSFVLVTVVQP